MPAKDINLIPNEVVRERNRNQAFRGLLVFGLVVFAIAIGGLFVSSFLSATANRTLSGVQNQVSAAEGELAKLQDVQKEGSMLTARLKYIKGLLDNKTYYSILMDKLNQKSKTGITINSVQISKDFTLTLTGTSANTTLLQVYVLGLIADNETFFIDPRITQVSIKEDDGSSTFTILVDVNKDELYKIID